MNKSESITKLAPALLAAQLELKSIPTSGKNPYFKSKYATLSDVLVAIKVPLNNSKIVFLQAISDQGVETILMHESGEWISCLTPIVCAKKNDPQSFGSAVTYAKRYAIQSLMGLATEDEDDDGERAVSRIVYKKSVKPIPSPSVSSPKPEPGETYVEYDNNIF